MCEFKKNPFGSNEVLDLGEHGYISYNVAPCRGMPAFQSDGLSDETAIKLIKEDGECKWLILNGDFREEYKKAAKKGIKAVLEVYDRHKKECHSSWSTDEIDVAEWFYKRAENITREI